MKNEFKIFLADFRKEVDETCNNYLAKATIPKPKGMDAFLMLEMQQREARKAVKDYHKVWKALAILSGDSILKETVDSVHSDTMDQKGLIYKIEFTQDQISSIVRYVQTRDHIGFTNFIASLTNNRVARSYSTAIFEKAPRK